VKVERRRDFRFLILEFRLGSARSRGQRKRAPRSEQPAEQQAAADEQDDEDLSLHADIAGRANGREAIDRRRLAPPLASTLQAFCLELFFRALTRPA
jgi:hypothetical protein